MTQLTDDCFRMDQPLIPLADAVARLIERVGPIDRVEVVPLDRAAGRYLAEDVTSPHDIPAYDNSAVDGFAVYFDDLNTDGPTVLPVVGRVAAGHPLPRAMKRGEAVRIFTGAPMPEGDGAAAPDTVFMVEDVEEAGDTVTLPPGIKRGSNRRFAGEDVGRNSVAVARGMRLGPAEIGMLAACGRTEVEVFGRLRAAVFSTGDEVVEPGRTPRDGGLPDGALYDSNRFMIAAALRALGADVTDLGILPDKADAIGAAIAEAAAGHDVLMSSGGMSMGEEDHVRERMEAQGTLAFWRLAIKPGRPVGMGLVGHAEERTPFIGLPGNPVAALTTFVTVARPMLLRLSGASDVHAQRHKVVSGFDYRKKPGRREFVRVRLGPATEGEALPQTLPVAEKHGRGGAAILSSLVGADGFMELEEDRTHISAGEVVTFLPFSEVL